MAIAVAVVAGAVTGAAAFRRRVPKVSASALTAGLVVAAVVVSAGATWTGVDVGHSGAKATWDDLPASRDGPRVVAGTQHRRRAGSFRSRSAAPAHTDHDDLEAKGSPLTPRHPPSTTPTTRPFLRGLATVAAVLVVLAAGILVLRPDARQYLSFQLSDQIGAPANAEVLEPFPADDAPLVRLAVAGDVGTGGDEEQRTADAMDAARRRARLRRPAAPGRQRLSQR